ncbi:MAG: rpsP [Candidatus Saccharibacteria bacterium]|nr:rpsP [Candidatus Saccharibacteria bacterium]
MLAIRLQRLGRSGYPTYRVAVQESQRHPSSGRVVAYVGSYNPHTKQSHVQVELAQKYLDNGAQPSPRVVKLLKDAGVVLPKWVNELGSAKQKGIRHPDKLRKNQPKEEPVAEVAPAPEAAEADTAEPTEAPAK